MNELDQVYLIFAFPDSASLTRAARSLDIPGRHLAVLGVDESEMTTLAGTLGARAELKGEIPLDAGQRQRLDWYLEERNKPLLAVEVMAAKGRELRLHLQAFGAQEITDPEISSQTADVDFDPGQASDKPELPPGKNRVNAPN